MKAICLKFTGILLILAVLLSLGITGCSSSSTTTTAGTSGTSGTATTTLATVTAKASSNLIIWSDASNHVGKKVTLFGPIIDSTHIGGFTVLGMGVSVNATGGVDIKIADTDKDQFPGDLYIAEVIQVTGTVDSDANGISMTITDPSQVIVTD